MSNLVESIRTIPPRAQVVLNSNSEFALICVRFVADYATFFLYNTAEKTLKELGSFRGKAYFNRCSISSDGRFSCLMFLNGRCEEFTWSSLMLNSTFEAQASWIVGDTREGGGIFEGYNCKLNILHKELRGTLPGDYNFSYSYDSGGDVSFYFRYLSINGWNVLKDKNASFELSNEWRAELIPLENNNFGYLFRFRLSHPYWLARGSYYDSMAIQSREHIVVVTDGVMQLIQLNQNGMAVLDQKKLINFQPTNLKPTERENLHKYLINPTLRDKD